ncbi:MAG TPA: hypothetical protein PLX08_03040 [Bacteroidales bacterium]|mgnify:CR=1 FL=1|nr:hypothetical protein [Bacteroidales bacterium]
MESFTNHPLYKAHTIDSAMDSLWSFYKSRFISLFSISLVMGLFVQYLSSFVNMGELQSMTDINEIMIKMKEFLLPMLAISLVSLLFTTILQYYVIFNPLDQANNIFRCTVASLKYFIPYIIIMVFLAFAGSFAIFVGLMLLVIGVVFSAVYIMMIYLFILPVMMVEGSNIGNTISSTIRLSHRHFWSNLGWTAVFIIILLVISVILSGLVLLPFTGSFLKAFTDPGEAVSLIEITASPLYIVLSSLMSAITFPLMPIFSAILYFNARAREENRLVSVASQEEEQKVKVEDLYAKPLPENTENDNDKV